MKNLLISLSAVAVTLSLVTPAFAAPMNSVFYFDAVREHNRGVSITNAVIDHSIDPEVAKVQTQTIDGKRTLVYTAYDSNMTALERHCNNAQLASNKDANLCHYKTGKTRVYPTVTSAF